jgi:hypothetical protein
MGGKDGQAHAYSAEDKNECRCSSTANISPHGAHRNNLKQAYVLQMNKWTFDLKFPFVYSGYLPFMHLYSGGCSGVVAIYFATFHICN